MKTLGIILAIFGVLNILRGIITISQAPPEYQQQGLGVLLLGIVFIAGSIYAFNRKNKDKEDKEEFDKWNNS